jgi:hypothetical protein
MKGLATLYPSLTQTERVAPRGSMAFSGVSGEAGIL